MIDLQGWIPPDERNKEQRELAEQFDAECPAFSLAPVEAPERVIFAELEKSVLGKLLPRVWQTTGSCVGAAGANAYMRAMLGDVYYRGDQEEIKLPFPYATYGVGRQIGGMRRTGDGSFGASQAKACQPEHFGILPWDDSRFPQPTIRNGWAKWTASEERTWSHPSAWPISKSELHADAKQFGLHTVTRVQSTEQWKQLLAQGYSVTLASSFGTSPKVRGNVLIGPWNKSWAHQMHSSGYWEHPDHGLLFVVDNQWGDAHGRCPTLSEIGVVGSFWITDDTAAKIIRNGEVFGHSATGGFPTRKFKWTLARFS